MVRVDSIGVGHNFALHLRDCRFPVEMINVGMPCESKPNLGENDPARRFVNLKACFYQALADAFERDQVEGLPDETTIGQLAGLLCELDSQGRMKLESKEKAQARGVPSPDRAEALMLALCKLPEKFEYRSVRDLPRLRRVWARPRTTRMTCPSADADAGRRGHREVSLATCAEVVGKQTRIPLRRLLGNARSTSSLSSWMRL